MKKVLIVSANRWSFCIGTERHFALSQGPDVQVDAIDLYQLVTRHSPYYRRLHQRVGEAINRKYERFILPILSGQDITPRVSLDLGAVPPLPETFDELRNYRLRGAQIGLGVISSIISLTTIQRAERVEELGPEVIHSWRAAHLSLQAGEAIRDMGYDEVYIFNGRHCYNRPFCDALEGAARVIKYEAGGSEDTTTYVASEFSVHVPSDFAGIIRSHDVDVCEGETYYLNRVNKAAGNEVNYFTGLQVKGQLPEEAKGPYVAFFTSSTDERVASLGEHDLGAFHDQCQVAQTLAGICARQGTRLIVRLHPHLRDKHPSWQHEWDFEALRSAGAVVLEPTDHCDSYALARSAHCVITAGSTISFECSFMGVPNAVVGDCLPGHMDSSVVCNDEAALEAFIAAPALLPEARENAIAFGSYMRVGGIALPDYELGGHVSQARLSGRILDPVRFAVHRFRRLLPARA
ncbi:MAG: hypothetical protein ACXWU1_06375 [Allosphingosinicella sp.]